MLHCVLLSVTLCALLSVTLSSVTAGLHPRKEEVGAEWNEEAQQVWCPSSPLSAWSDICHGDQGLQSWKPPEPSYRLSPMLTQERRHKAWGVFVSSLNVKWWVRRWGRAEESQPIHVAGQLGQGPVISLTEQIISSWFFCFNKWGKGPKIKKRESMVFDHTLLTPSPP